MKYQTTSSQNVLSSSVIIGKEFTKERKSVKDAYVSLNLLNSSIMPSDKLPEYQDLNKTAILDMYNSSQNTKLITSPKKESENYLCLVKDNTSPELFRQRNPFIKRVSDLTTSPSVLSNGNCRKRGRNLMRIKRTIIDENTVIESKYFSKQDNKEYNVLESENKEIEVNLKDTKYNIIPDIDTNDESQEQLKKTFITNIAENANSMENIDNAFLSNQNDCLTNTYRNVSEKLNSNNRIANISSMPHCITIDKKYISNNFLASSSNIEANDIIHYENADSLQNDLSKWSKIEIDQISHKRDIFKKQSSANLVNIHI